MNAETPSADILPYVLQIFYSISFLQATGIERIFGDCATVVYAILVCTGTQLVKTSPQTMADLAKSLSTDVPVSEAALRSVLLRLEKQLGVKLLRGKSSVGYVLTPRGRDLLPEARVRVAASDI